MIMKSSAKEMVMFRNSRKGYDKSDVNRYIEDMNIRFTTAENRYISTIRMLENDFDNLKRASAPKEELDKAVAEVTALKGALEAKEAELTGTQSYLGTVTEELEKAKAELENASTALEEARNKTAVVSAPTVSAAPDLSDAETKLGSILIKANLDAQKMLADAEDECRRKIAEAEKAAESIRFDAAVSARLMTESTKKELASLTEEYMRNLTSLSEESAGEYRRLCDELKAKFEAAELTAKEKLNF